VNAPEAPFLEVPDGISIAHYFIEETDRRNRGCDGIDLYREGRDYCYVWVEAMVDDDMQESYLLDIRTCVGDSDDLFRETRDFLYIRSGGGLNAPEVEWHNHPIRFDAPHEGHADRNYDGLVWFINRVELSRERMREGS
jgi:hypothetical protein